MKAKVFSFVKIADESMIASVRIAKFIRNTLDIPLCWDETIAEEPLDVLVIVNGAYAFSGSSLLSALGKAIFEAKQVVWIQNDFTIIPPKEDAGAESPFRKAFRDRKAAGKESVNYWTTVEPMSHPGRTPSGHVAGPKSQYLNWNCLTMADEFEIKPMSGRVFRTSMIYYGSYRKERVKYFDRYFKSPVVNTTISSPSKKFEENYQSLRVIHESKLADVYRYISEFGLGLYLEDKKSHVEFHSPANRFYEMLSAGLPIVFQPEAVKMMSKAGYQIGDWIVWDAKDVQRRMEEQEKIADTQRSWWHYHAYEERVALTPQLAIAWEKLRQ